MASSFLLIYYTDVAGHPRRGGGDAVPRRPRLGRPRRPVRRPQGRLRPRRAGASSVPTCSSARSRCCCSSWPCSRCPAAERRRQARLRLRLLRAVRAGLQLRQHPLRLAGRRDDPGPGRALQALRLPDGLASLTILLLAVVVSPQIEGSDDLQRSLTITTLGLRRDRDGVLPLHLLHRRGAGGARRGDGQPARNVGMLRHNRPLIVLCAVEPAVPHRHVLAADGRRLLRPRRARQRRPLHRDDASCRPSR